MSTWRETLPTNWPESLLPPSWLSWLPSRVSGWDLILFQIELPLESQPSWQLSLNSLLQEQNFLPFLTSRSVFSFLLLFFSAYFFVCFPPTHLLSFASLSLTMMRRTTSPSDNDYQFLYLMVILVKEIPKRGLVTVIFFLICSHLISLSLSLAFSWFWMKQEIDVWMLLCMFFVAFQILQGTIVHFVYERQKRLTTKTSEAEAGNDIPGQEDGNPWVGYVPSGLIHGCIQETKMLTSERRWW